MSESRSLYFNIFLHFAFLWFLTAIQSGLWYKLLGGFPPPFFWILFLSYISIYRKAKDTFLLGIIGFFLLMHFTIAPYPLVFLISFILVLLLQKAKQRVFWQGPTYYLAASSIATLAFILLYYFVSWSFEEAGFAKIRWLFLFLQWLLTTLISPFLYVLYQHIDKWTGSEQIIPMEDLL